MARTFVAASSQSLDTASPPVTAVPYSFACWFKNDGLSSQALISISQAASPSYSTLRTVGQVVTLEDFDGTNNPNCNSTGTFATGTWTHAAGVWVTTANRTVYRDGANAVNNTTPCTLTGIDHAAVGKIKRASDAYFVNGSVAEVGIWNIALTAADVAALALGLSPLFVRPDALVFYAPLYGQASPEVDLIGRRGLTVTGATASAHPRIYQPTGPLAFTTKANAAQFAAVSSFGLAAVAALGIRSPLAASATIQLSTAASFASAALAATSTISLAASASLSTAARFAAAASFGFATSALFGATRFVASASLRLSTAATLSTGTEVLHASRASITLAGIPVRVRGNGPTIHDVVDDNPNACDLTIDGLETPLVGQRLRVTLNLDAPRLLFNGSLQDVGLSYEELADQLVYPASAIDDTPRANRRRPFGAWTNVSASIVVLYLVDTFAPGFTATHVQAGLPPISIILDGSEGMNGALREITDLIGGYFFWQDGDLWLFTDIDITDVPDALDAFNTTLLKAPAIKARVNDRLLQTRALGKGHGEALLADIAPGETILPVANAAAWFGTVGAGGHAIALSQVLAYTGVQLGGGGSLVGIGASPSVAPLLARSAGPGASVDPGAHGYAYGFQTATGKSLPSPLASVTTGLIAGAGALTPTVQGGAGVDATIVDYEVTFYNAAGETAPIASSLFAYPYDVAAPSSGGTAANDPFGFGLNPNYCSIGDAVYVVIAYRNASGATTPGPASNTITAVANATWGSAQNIQITGIPQPSDPTVTGIQVFLNAAGVWKGSAILPVGSTAYSINVNVALTLSAAAPPVTNGASVRHVALTNIPISVEPETGRKVYRRNNATETFKLLTTINDTSTTTYTDSTPIASLGAAAPSTNTATAAQVNISAIAIGPAGTTARDVWRTTSGGTQLKLLTTIANNTATTFVDTLADSSLGANAPTVDASGLTQVGGQVLAGSTSLITTGAAFPPSGWVLLGGQVVRYTGITGNTLTGIPATGIGALLTTVKYGDAVLPAPALTGVTGVVVPILTGTPINIWVQRDDLPAQAELTARDGTDGIVEAAPITDERRGEASLIALCDATLARYSRPLVSVTFDSRDVKLKSGMPVVIDLVTPPIHQTLTIQEVTITEIGIADGLPPRFSVTASSERQSLDGLLRKLLAAAA